MKIIAANTLSICFLAACMWFVWTNHITFGAISLIISAVNAHTYKSEGEA